MRYWNLLPLLALLAIPPGIPAANPAPAAQLQALGGKIVTTDGKVTQLTFTDCTRLGDPEFQAISQLVHLKSLTLYGKAHGLNDSTAPFLSSLKDLENLSTEGAQLSDEGMKFLSSLTSLKSASFFHLSFGMKGFTGAGFGHLKPCTRLEKLTVAGMSMGDEGFAAIASLPQIRDLRTWHTFQTEAGNTLIAKLPNLSSLQIGQRLPGHGNKKPSLSDTSLPTIAGIKTLETLKIGEAHFTLEALLALKGLPKLKSLSLYETDLVQADLDRLRAELPSVKIDWQPLTPEQRKKFDMYLKP